METQTPPTRERILTAAATLLGGEGRDALSTRSVAAAAGVQVPAIYRHFGDKQGLLDALAEYGVAEYLSEERSLVTATSDPLSYLREGWDLHIAFGLAKPAFYLLVYAEPRSPAARQIEERLRAAFAPLAEAGRLSMSVDRATRLMLAAGIGVVLTLTAQPERDASLSPLVRELVLSAVLVDAFAAPSTKPGLGSALATVGQALAAGTDDILAALTEPERALMAQWVERMQDAGGAISAIHNRPDP